MLKDTSLTGCAPGPTSFGAACSGFVLGLRSERMTDCPICGEELHPWGTANMLECLKCGIKAPENAWVNMEMLKKHPGGNATMVVGEPLTVDFTLNYPPVKPNTVAILVGGSVLHDDGNGNLWGRSKREPLGTIDYSSGKCKVMFSEYTARYFYDIEGEQDA
jgi:hypothetical protein